MQILKKQTQSRSGSVFGVCFGVQLCLDDTVQYPVTLPFPFPGKIFWILAWNYIWIVMKRFLGDQGIKKHLWLTIVLIFMCLISCCFQVQSPRYIDNAQKCLNKGLVISLLSGREFVLSRQFVGSILASAFLCLFEGRRTTQYTNTNLNSINFSRFFYHLPRYSINITFAIFSQKFLTFFSYWLVR